MPTVTIQEAQARLPDLIHRLSPGDEVVITENNEPVAKLARTEPKTQWPCKAGSAKGTIHWMAPDFDAPLQEFKEYVDVCRQRYDVVLMNPPFGESSKPARGLLEKQYPRTKNDLYAAFVEMGLRRLHPGALLGAITSRTGFFLSSFQKWREEVLLREALPTVFADLDYGVLDTAMVETAAYCLVKSQGGR